MSFVIRPISMLLTAAVLTGAGPAGAQSANYGVDLSSNAITAHAGSASCYVNLPQLGGQTGCVGTNQTGSSGTLAFGPGSNSTLATVASATAHEEGGTINGYLASASASAAADLSTGSLHLSAGASYPDTTYDASTGVDAALWDTLHFTVLGASASTTTTIGVSFSIDGRMDSAAGTTSNGELFGALIFGGHDARFDLVNNASTGHTTQSNGLDTYPFGFDNGVWTANADFTVVTFSGTYTLTGATQDVFAKLNATLNCNASPFGSAQCDYGNTLGLTLQLPGNVSFTSDSGVFLSAVPEPAPSALLLAGLAVMGGIVRRRKLCV